MELPRSTRARCKPQKKLKIHKMKSHTSLNHRWKTRYSRHSFFLPCKTITLLGSQASRLDHPLILCSKKHEVNHLSGMTVNWVDWSKENMFLFPAYNTCWAPLILSFPLCLCSLKMIHLTYSQHHPLFLVGEEGGLLKLLQLQEILKKKGGNGPTE